MSVVDFGNYRVMGTEGSTFDVGRTPKLDVISGFFDAQFREGDRLFFLVSDDELSAASEAAFEAPERFRELLHSAPMITGTVVLSASTDVLCRIERRERFREIYERKERPISNEILDVVQHYDDIWRHTREALERMGARYSYRVDPRLPSLSAVREGLRRGLTATKCRWDTTHLLESFPEERSLRVVAYGPNDSNSCRIYDILDPDGYRAAIEERAEAAQLKREARFWSYLLD